MVSRECFLKLGLEGLLRLTGLYLIIVSSLFSGCQLVHRGRNACLREVLEVPQDGSRILRDWISSESVNRKSFSELFTELQAVGATRNLTIGLLFSDVSDLTVKGHLELSDVQRILDSNLATHGHCSLVLSGDIEKIARRREGRYLYGEFVWSVPGLIRGRARYVTERDKIIYLGIPFRNHKKFFDCMHVFSPAGDMRVWAGMRGVINIPEPSKGWDP